MIQSNKLTEKFKGAPLLDPGYRELNGAGMTFFPGLIAIDFST